MKNKFKDKKQLVAAISLGVILLIGLYVSTVMISLPVTFNGKGMDLVALYEDPHGYPNLDASGVATVMVKENLDKTISDNVVASVVFNFRGYDTMGEAFILITTIAGTTVILRNVRKKKED